MNHMDSLQKYFPYSSVQPEAMRVPKLKSLYAWKSRNVTDVHESYEGSWEVKRKMWTDPMEVLSSDS